MNVQLRAAIEADIFAELEERRSKMGVKKR